jgi:hypothetical protein
MPLMYLTRYRFASCRVSLKIRYPEISRLCISRDTLWPTYRSRLELQDVGLIGAPVALTSNSISHCLPCRRHTSKYVPRSTMLCLDDTL